MLGRTDRRLRLIVLLVAFVVLASAIVTRLTYWQIARGPELRGMATSRLERPAEDQAMRGDILDRRGTVLATTEYDDLLSAYPEQIPEQSRATVVQVVGDILGFTDRQKSELAEQLTSEAAYVVIARRLTDAQSAAIGEAASRQEIRGFNLEPRAYRFYPNPGGAPGTTLASQLLGFVTEDGNGQYGIEQHYQSVLAGRPRVVAALHDSRGRVLNSSERVLDPGIPGADIRLTLDASLQLQVEKELYAAWVADRSVRVSALVLDPDNGDVLAWASVPGYDANASAQIAATSPDLFQDPLISQIYEPGSVMKMFSAAAALDSGTVELETKVKDSSALVLGPNTVHNADRRGKGWMEYRDVIAYSRNVGTAKTALRMGRDVKQASTELYKAWRRLGLGETTGIDLSGEIAGLVTDPKKTKWQAIDLANRSFGQGVAITPIQLATAFGAMANGGSLVHPHVATAVGEQAVVVPTAERAIDRRLATDLRSLMEHVVSSVPWYAAGTLIPGYTVGGKTGTAQIWDAERGRWIWNTFNFSFTGFVGTDRPEAIILTRIHHTQPDVVGRGELELGITSYELFRRIAIDTVSALDLPALPTPQAPDRVAKSDGDREERPDGATGQGDRASAPGG